MRALNFDSTLGKSPRSHHSWYLENLILSVAIGSYQGVDETRLEAPHPDLQGWHSCAWITAGSSGHQLSRERNQS